jgi:hypothetical protein
VDIITSRKAVVYLLLCTAVLFVLPYIFYWNAIDNNAVDYVSTTIIRGKIENTIAIVIAVAVLVLMVLGYLQDHFTIQYAQHLSQTASDKNLKQQAEDLMKQLEGEESVKWFLNYEVEPQQYEQMQQGLAITAYSVIPYFGAIIALCAQFMNQPPLQMKGVRSKYSVYFLNIVQFSFLIAFCWTLNQHSNATTITLFVFLAILMLFDAFEEGKDMIVGSTKIQIRFK